MFAAVPLGVQAVYDASSSHIQMIPSVAAVSLFLDVFFIFILMTLAGADLPGVTALNFFFLSA